MRFARDVIMLLAADPAREWRVQHIVNQIAGTRLRGVERERHRKGVRRVLLALIDARVIECRTGDNAKSPPLYRWKDSHE